MADNVPEWAKQRACELANAVGDWAVPVKWGQAQHYALGQAFARYIAEHEEPPVDPLLIEAREIVAQWYADNPKMGGGTREPTRIRAGEIDAGAEVTQTIVALKRGMELAGERK
jgi:hypothetical protein